MTQIYLRQESTTEGGRGGGAFQTSPNKWRVVEYERGWSEFAPILYPFKGHFLCYWLAVVHTWQLRSPGEAVSGGTRPTWNAHTGEEIGLETNRHTEDAAARWGNWKIQKGRGNEETRPLTSFILKSCFLIRTQSVRYGPNNTWNARILSGCVRTTLPSFHGHKYCDLEKSMLYREGGSSGQHHIDLSTSFHSGSSVATIQDWALLNAAKCRKRWEHPVSETQRRTVSSLKLWLLLWHDWNILNVSLMLLN